MSKDIDVVQPGETKVTPVSVFESIESFESSQRIANMLCSTSMIPVQFQGKENLGNCVIALELSRRTGMPIFAVMQNINIIHGRPSWSSVFLIGCINSCGMFHRLKFRSTGENGTDSQGCVAWTTAKEDPDTKLESIEVTVEMAKREGWYARNGSKWQNLREIMLVYRAASFWSKMYAPEFAMGMNVSDETQVDSPRELKSDHVWDPLGGVGTRDDTVRINEYIPAEASDASKPNGDDGLAEFDNAVPADIKDPPMPEEAPTETVISPDHAVIASTTKQVDNSKDEILHVDGDDGPALINKSGEFVQSDGAHWDPEVHATKANGKPSYNKDMTFRAKRQTKQNQESDPVKAADRSGNGTETLHDQDELPTDRGDPTTNKDLVLSGIETSNSIEDLNDTTDFARDANLTPEDRNFVNMKLAHKRYNLEKESAEGQST